ncbi:MAG: 16S rRNA (cytidine(1402)-2'-O)-methyltransferase [Rhodobacterales bacterium]|nr:16S rRNA (cytidine(1402)-2'-O)-methyltransferase [Rhodobacterales bacterium]
MAKRRSESRATQLESSSVKSVRGRPAAPESAPGSEPTAAGEQRKPEPGLYLVATPIGNARDITLRALDVLAGVDRIACEDTRVTGKLLSIHGIGTPLMPYHDHNADAVRPRIIKALKSGESVALVSDAGTPLVSDPGHKLVAAAVAEGLPVTALPGASAVLTALQLAALPTDRFLFAGFPPNKAAARRRMLSELATAPATLVFLESPRRLADSLADMAAVLGDRPAAVGRELTKRFEEVRRDALPALAAHYAQAGPPKGEVTVCVGPPGDEGRAPADDATVDALLAEALATARVRDAAADVAARTGRPRKDVYARALALKDGKA